MERIGRMDGIKNMEICLLNYSIMTKSMDEYLKRNHYQEEQNEPDQQQLNGSETSGPIKKFQQLKQTKIWQKIKVLFLCCGLLSPSVSRETVLNHME